MRKVKVQFLTVEKPDDSGEFCEVVANMLDCDIVVSEFELNSVMFIFGLILLEKV